MNLHYFQHVPFEGIASIETWAISKGYRLTATRFFAGDLMPRLDQFDWLVSDSKDRRGGNFTSFRGISCRA